MCMPSRGRGHATLVPAQRSARFLPQDQWITVRYEELVRDPEAVLTTLMRFLGEDFVPEQVDFYATGPIQSTDRRNEQRLRQPVSADSIERWREALTAREIRMIEAETGGMMERLGHEPSFPDAKLSGAERLAIRLIEHPIHRALGLSKNRKGFRHLGHDLAWRQRRLGVRLFRHGTNGRA